MSPPSEHERHAQFLRHYAESEVALHTFVRSLVPTRQMASEVMQDVILVLWEKFDAAADFQGWADADGSLETAPRRQIGYAAEFALKAAQQP